jgi:hypothetical protein
MAILTFHHLDEGFMLDMIPLYGLMNPPPLGVMMLGLHPTTWQTKNMTTYFLKKTVNI